jgi:hypothetical protein
MLARGSMVCHEKVRVESAMSDSGNFGLLDGLERTLTL